MKSTKQTKYLFTAIVIPFLFVLSSLFWDKDIANNHTYLSSIELGWPTIFIIQDFSSIDPPEDWYPHKVSLGLPQERPTDFNEICFLFDWALVSVTFFAVLFTINRLENYN